MRQTGTKNTSRPGTIQYDHQRAEFDLDENKDLGFFDCPASVTS